MNSKAFTPEEVKKGLHLDLIKYLLDYNTKSDESYYDIHIDTDGYCAVISYEDVPYNGEWGGHFEYVDEDQRVMTECRLPDNSTVMCYDEDDVKETLDNFLKDNPGWRKTEYGTWTNDIENEAFRKSFEKEAGKLEEDLKEDYGV